ncbi:hypothetical protein J6590_003463 [Homalodisca vitripennis]|nr:hypothetical protein J6590_003463 [Homalodisca vitripennis]
MMTINRFGQYRYAGTPENDNRKCADADTGAVLSRDVTPAATFESQMRRIHTEIRCVEAGPAAHCPAAVTPTFDEYFYHFDTTIYSAEK